MPEPVNVGVIGCGAISAAYFSMAAKLPILNLVACSDLDLDKARARAEEFGIPRVCSVDKLLADDDVEVVLNLTVPKAHAPVALQALEAGKHTFAEKPLGISREEGETVLRAAAERGLRVGCAPDTFLGAGVQTARKLIDEGAIGVPIGFSAFMMCHGHESWHPNPEFYYEVGGGPMFDMGPYYLTSLLNYLGAVKRLSGAASIAVPERVITSQPKYGKRIAVETPDHIVGTMEFAGGAVGIIVTTFAVWHPTEGGACPITVYGTEGSLRCPNPNSFDGELQIRGRDDGEWRPVPHQFITGYGRAIGLADMAHAIRTGRPHRCSAEQSFAVLDLMQGFLDSSASGRFYEPVGGYERPAPMPTGLPFGELDD